MATVARFARGRKTTRPAVRSVRIVSGLCGENAGTILITVDGQATAYEVWRLDDRSWQVTKIGETGDLDFAAGEYHVRLDGPDSNCDCKGYSYTGRCKHTAALLALAARKHL